MLQPASINIVTAWVLRFKWHDTKESPVVVGMLKGLDRSALDSLAASSSILRGERWAIGQACCMTELVWLSRQCKYSSHFLPFHASSRRAAEANGSSLSWRMYSMATLAEQFCQQTRKCQFVADTAPCQHDPVPRGGMLYSNFWQNIHWTHSLAHVRSFTCSCPC